MFSATTFFICSSFLTLTSSVPLEDFFRFGVEHGDVDLRPSDMDDGSSERLSLSIAFPFFDYLHDSLWVNINGAVSFVNSISAYTPTCSAVEQQFRMISPYWSDVDLRKKGKLFYRESFNANDLQKATKELRNAFPELKRVKIKWLFLTTWYKVPFFKAHECGSDAENTFQLVLASDGVHSFTIFYYNNITWTTGKSEKSGGNCHGLGGKPAKAGFDAGDGKSLYMIPSSCTPDIVNISSESNVGSPGKFVFRVDDKDIQTAGCHEEFTGNVRVVPNFIDMYGHVPLEIIGPCVNDSLRLLCRFHDPVKGITELPGEGIGENTTDFKAVCTAPFLYSTGRIRIELVTRFRGQENIYSGALYVIPPQEGDERLNVTIGVLSDKQRALTFSWNVNRFSKKDRLDIILYAYNKSINEYVIVKSFVDNITNNGIFIRNFTETELEETKLTSLTFAIQPRSQVRVARSIRYFLRRMPYFTVPLSIYELLCEDLGCKLWYNLDDGPPNDLPPCPPTTALARADSDFEIDPACRSPPCTFHPGADFCIRSRNPSDSGGGQQCCYKGEEILLGPPAGGTADQYHYKSLPGHIAYDVVPFSMCCQNFTLCMKEKPQSMCHRYYEKRPSDPGTNYTAPQPAGARGDPHITTFDRLDYTFNGAGEFWLVKNGTNIPVVVQSRMEQFAYPNGTTKDATVFTAFAMKCNDSSVVEIYRSLIRSVDIYVDDIVMDLDNPLLMDVNFDQVQVSVKSDLSLVTVTFTCGFTFQISVTAGAMSILATADEKYKTKTRGLMGVYDDDKSNDLQDRDGNIISPDSSLEDIHYKFGMSWRVSISESLFRYNKNSYATYNIIDFRPSFVQPNFEFLSRDVKDMCGNAADCLYDYVTTGSPEFAEQTKNISIAFTEIVKIYEEKVVMCTPLEYPSNGYYQAKNFLPGATVTFGCHEGFALLGDLNITCSVNATWIGSEPYCHPTSGGRSWSSWALQMNVMCSLLLGILIKFSWLG